MLAFTFRETYKVYSVEDEDRMLLNLRITSINDTLNTNDSEVARKKVPVRLPGRDLI